MCDSILQSVVNYFPEDVRRAVMALSIEKQKEIEEFRFRNGCEVTIISSRRTEEPLSLSYLLLCDPKLIQAILNAATGYSAYAAEETMRNGFFILPGGHRLGICGTAVTEQGQIRTLKAISSVNLRVARQRIGCANSVFEQLQKKMRSTLIIGTPNSGKTTLLRDLVRQLSDKAYQRVGLVDSRGEIAACWHGTPQLQIGRRTDVISMSPKAQGMEMLLRTMNPQWIVVDEITAEEDVGALIHSAYCGVSLLATAHAFDKEDLNKRSIYRKVIEAGVFENLIVLDHKRNAKLERM